MTPSNPVRLRETCRSRVAADGGVGMQLRVGDRQIKACYLSIWVLDEREYLKWAELNVFARN